MSSRHRLWHWTCVSASVPHALGLPIAIRGSRQSTFSIDVGPTLSGGKLAAGTRFAKALNAESVRWVRSERTPLTAGQAEVSISDAFREQTGRPLSAAGRAILTAQWAHETGHGASMFNYNFGGIKGASPMGLSVAQPTREGYANTERRIVDGFRAYPNASEGASDYVRLLRSRYSAALEAAERGDASGFVRELKVRGYFTGDPVAYERNIISVSSQILGGASPASEQLNATRPSPFEGSSTSRKGNGSRLDQSAAHALFDTVPLLEARELSATILGAHGLTSYEQGVSGTRELATTRALDMADQITRAALRIAFDEQENRRARPDPSR